VYADDLPAGEDAGKDVQRDADEMPLAKRSVDFCSANQFVRRGGHSIAFPVEAN
jgi:hypothetical protein